MYSSAVERLTADQQVPGSNPGAPFFFVLILSFVPTFFFTSICFQNFSQHPLPRGSAFSTGHEKWTEGLENVDETPAIKLGDASIAAPFTSRTPSINAVVDVIRQGRCTLLSAVQQMQIMMLDSMISAYALAMMSADGTRPSEQQMMASGKDHLGRVAVVGGARWARGPRVVLM